MAPSSLILRIGAGDVRTSRARSGKVGVPRFFVCCHKARWSGTSGGRIAESRPRRPNWGSLAVGRIAKQLRDVRRALRLVARINGGACGSASQNGRAKPAGALAKSLIPPDGGRGKSGLAQTGAMLRDRSSLLPCRDGAIAGSTCFCRLPSARGRVSRLVCSVVALRRNQRSGGFAGNCSQKTGEPRFAFFSRAGGRVDSGWHPALLAGRRRFSPIKFFLTKNPLPSAIDSTERACGRRPCR
ncbi:hypothetical protein AWB76_04225 [Caballeronia temeraria]|uniref:Uncharacterized protein n=1 Tax=Caballeronia temeraria TaxID=1777137 RepID=A0A158BIJ1_9BURK|nr:hypothetical protein AWB76_04225 [Caballeronia temeraria]